MILEDWKSIFIHIPKTGGGSLEVLLLKKYFNCTRMPFDDPRRKELIELNGRWTQHDSIQKTVKQRGVKAKDYFKFCFVRNPWDKAVSEYFYIKKMKGCDCEEANIPKTFKDWVKKGMSCSWEGHTDPQINFTTNREGNNIMDFIGRFENLRKDTDFVLDKLNIKAKLPHVNQSDKRNPYLSYYDEYTRDIIAERYKKDIDYFDYHFEEQCVIKI
jgi:chondroitin 4-sulfotransferase 11